MGKGDRRGKSKQSKAALPELKPVPRPKKRGKARDREIKATDRTEKRETLEARLRQFGIGMQEERGMDGSVDVRAATRNQRALATMDSPAMSDPGGRAIYLAHKDPKAASMFKAYAGLAAAEERYARIVLGAGLHPKTAKVEFLPERMETSADDDGPDLRSDDERMRDVANAWARWRGIVMHLSVGHQTAIFNVIRGRKTPHRAGQLTTSGKIFVEAVAALQDVVDRQG